MINHNAFLSYASEDTELASDIVRALEARGLSIWYAPIDLKVGDKILDSIEKGMKESVYGILLLSPAYLKKGWTNYEMDTLLRDNIEKDKKLLPIWHNVTKQEVEERHSGLAGIVAIKSDVGLPEIIKNLAGVMTDHAPMIGVIPSYESPKWRFLQGRGEINLQSEDGPATTLWEFLIHTKDNQYPLYLDGDLFSKEDLLLRAAQLLPHIPDVVDNWVTEDGRRKIHEMCKEIGADPDVFA